MQRTLLVAPLLGIFLGSVPAEAGIIHRLDKLFVFGDSLSDSGNSKGVSGGFFPPSPPYNGGRFTNGKVAAEYLWDAFNPGNTAFKPSFLPGGTNYAIGGATSGQKNVISQRTDIGALAGIYNNKGNAWQLPQFLGAPSAFTPAVDADTSLFMVWFFPNDVFWNRDSGGQSVGTSSGSTFSPPVDLISEAVANVKSTIQTLANAGARKFLIPNTPDLGATPEYRNTALSAPYTDLSNQFNLALTAALADVRTANPQIDLVEFQTDDAFAELTQNPSSFGLTNTTDRCLTRRTSPPPLFDVCPDPNSYLFWDGNHPTDAVHRVLGQRFFQSVYAVPGPLPAAGAVAALAWSRRLRRRIKLDCQKTSHSCGDQFPAD